MIAMEILFQARHRKIVLKRELILETGVRISRALRMGGGIDRAARATIRGQKQQCKQLTWHLGWHLGKCPPRALGLIWEPLVLEVPRTF